ncbi:hypothetical protein HDG37_003984 [Paraburkholderia sp. MM5384-R2]|nr:hypothetical protein [Paraburkholderia sp. MM5384-R2]
MVRLYSAKGLTTRLNRNTTQFADLNRASKNDVVDQLGRAGGATKVTG